MLVLSPAGSPKARGTFASSLSRNFAGFGFWIGSLRPLSLRREKAPIIPPGEVTRFAIEVLSPMLPRVLASPPPFELLLFASVLIPRSKLNNPSFPDPRSWLVFFFLWRTLLDVWERIFRIEKVARPVSCCIGWALGLSSFFLLVYSPDLETHSLCFVSGFSSPSAQTTSFLVAETCDSW